MQARRRALAALQVAVLQLAALAGTVACGSDGGAEPEPAGGDPPQEPAAPAPSGPPPAPPGARPAIRVSFRLDPALTGGAYMGERWVSPPVFQAAAQTGDTFRVEARAEVAGGSGAVVTWTPSDPDAVSVSPTWDARVEIAVSRPGRSTLTVAAGDGSATLAVAARHEDGRWLVTFSETGHP